MKSSFEILDALFTVINIPLIKNEISGKIFSNSFPDGNQDENITISVLNNTNKYLQDGFINVNIYIKEIKSGRPNLQKMRSIVDKLIPLLKDIKYGDFTFQIDDDKGVFKDQDRDSMYFYNLRLRFQTI